MRQGDRGEAVKLISEMNPVELAEETEKIKRLRKEFDDYWKTEGPVFASMFGVETGVNQPVGIVAWNAYLKGRSVEKPKCVVRGHVFYDGHWKSDCDTDYEEKPENKFCPDCGGEIEVKP
jgi:hypothetical protein